MATIGRRLWRATQKWMDDDGSLMAASVGYYTALAFFPLLLVLMAGLGVFLEVTPTGRDAEQHLITAISGYASPSVGEDVREMLAGVREQAGVSGRLGLAVLLFTSITMFANFDYAFGRIWNYPNETRGLLGTVRNVLLVRFRAFLLLLGVGVLVVVVFVAGLTMSTLRVFGEYIIPIPDLAWQMLQLGVSIVLNTLVFTLLYRFLPRREVFWGDAAQGGLLAAVAWEIGRAALTMFLVGGAYSPYGLVGSFIAIMLWIYYAACVIFLGAEYVQVVYGDRQPLR